MQVTLQKNEYTNVSDGKIRHILFYEQAIYVTFSLTPNKSMCVGPKRMCVE